MLAVVASLGAAAAPAPAADSLGTDFWVGYLSTFRACGGLGGACDKPSIKDIWITGPNGTSGSVVGGFPNPVTIPFTITANNGTFVNFNGAVEFPQGEHTGHTGVHVTADQPVAVHGSLKVADASEAFTALPTDGLGTKYTVLSWASAANFGGQLVVVAPEDGTTVTIRPSVAMQGGHAAGAAYQVSLDEGDVYQGEAVTQTPALDPTGTLITSSKPVAVFAGHHCTGVPGTSLPCNPLVEQLPPDEFWGTSYLTTPLKTNVGATFVLRPQTTHKIVARDDGTVVRVNGAIVANLNGGEKYDAFAGTAQVIPDNSVISANRPILVGVYSNSQGFDKTTLNCSQGQPNPECNADPFLLLLPPMDRYLQAYTVPTFTTFTNGPFAFTHYVNLVVPSADADAARVSIDGVAVPADHYTAIGTSGFKGAQEQVPIGVGFHSITTTGGPFGVTDYGYLFADAYGFPAAGSLEPPAGLPPAIAKVVVSPASETTTGLATKCVTATVTDAASAPAPGVRVDFKVTGANAATGSAITGAGGVTPPFCYTPKAFGEDTVTAAVGATSGTAKKTWVDPSAGGGGGDGSGGGGGSTGGPAPPAAGGPTTSTSTTTAPATTTKPATTTPATTRPTTTPTTTTASKTQTAAQVTAAAVAEALAGLPSARRCVSRRHFKIRLRQPRKLKVLAAIVRLQNRTVATRKGKRYTAPVDLRGYPKGAFVVRITLLFNDGTSNISKRRYRTCVPKKRRRGQTAIARR